MEEKTEPQVPMDDHPEAWQKPASNEPINPAHHDDVEAITKAAALVDGFRKEKARLEEMLTTATNALRDRNREVELLGLDLAQAQNNLQTLQAQVEEFRQENSEYRAFFSSMKAQMDHFEIPLPIRKRIKKNGNGDKAAISEQYVPKNDPRLNEIVGKP